MDIVYYVATSLDGFIAKEDGGVDWLEPFNTPDNDYGFSDFNNSIDALVMGRKTYEKSLTFGEWPEKEKPCWVFSSQSLEPVAPNITITTESPTDIVGQLKERGLKKCWFMGGGELAGVFLRDGLMTELMIFTMPVLLGQGIRLFRPGDYSVTLTLLDSRGEDNGVLKTHYRVEKPAEPERDFGFDST